MGDVNVAYNVTMNSNVLANHEAEKKYIIMINIDKPFQTVGRVVL